MKLHPAPGLARSAVCTAALLACASLSTPVAHAQVEPATAGATVPRAPAATQAASAAAAALADAPLAPTQPGAASAPLARAGRAAAADGKDVVLDAAPVARSAPPASSAAPTTAPRLARTAVFSTPVHSAAAAGTLAELGLDLLRQHSAETGNAQRNAVVSPLSLAAAMGMVHAGTLGAGARELSQLVGSASSGERFYAARLPWLLGQLQPGASPAAPVAAGRNRPAAAPPPFTAANRVWIDRTAAPSVPAPYAALVQQRLDASAAVVAFAKPEEARQAINSWVAQTTGRRITELMPSGAVNASTRVVVTNAVHFKSAWARKFDPTATTPMPFQVAGGPAKPVPTMVDERPVLSGVVDNITVYEIPFAGDTYALMIGLPPAGHTLDALETDLAGLDMAAWSSQLKPKTCQLELPRFTLAPSGRSLKVSLQALGVRTVFSDAADFSPLLGQAARGVHLDDVFQSASVTIDEAGGEAAAATGASMVAKSFSLSGPARCSVDRPFVFAIVHKPTGAPLFVGKVADPSRP